MGRSHCFPRALAVTGWLVVCVTSAPVRSDAVPPFAVLPEKSALVGPHSRQPLLVEGVVNGHFAGDKTELAQFATSDPAVATVDDRPHVPLQLPGERLHVLVAGVAPAHGEEEVVHHPRVHDDRRE